LPPCNSHARIVANKKRTGKISVNVSSKNVPSWERVGSG
jgi:hypothetical protein